MINHITGPLWVLTLLVVAFILSLFSFGVDAQEVTPEEDKQALEWMKAVSNKVNNDANSEEAKEFARQALLKATKEKEKSKEKVLITKDGIDLEGFITRYRLDQGTMKKALVDPASFYVFVSFSMDIKAIQNIGRDVGRVGGTLVLRGLVDNSLKATTAKIAELQEVLKGDAASQLPQAAVSVEMIIDPTLYEKFRVQSVPAFVVTSESEPKCLTDGCEESYQPYDRVSGMVPVEYALKTIAERGFEAKDHAQKLLKKLEAE